MKARVLYVAAAALVAAALAFPLWGFAMAAPQYPDETLHLQVTRTGIAGDVLEVSTLQHFIGVRFPTELPELKWATRAIVAFAALLLAGAFVGAGTAGRVYRVLCAVALARSLSRRQAWCRRGAVPGRRSRSKLAAGGMRISRRRVAPARVGTSRCA